MCGILGVLSPDLKNISIDLDCLKHRGPDFQDYCVLNNLYLGSTRLAISDISKNGNQPMFSNDGNYVLVFNGEIYNHKQIRKEYLSSINFNSTSDTETLLYYLINYGIEALANINGIFAFAFYDISNCRLYLCRDQTGVKPLYYYSDSHLFLFASEIKAFKQFNLNNEIKSHTLKNYFKYLWSPGQECILKNHFRILPGTYLLLDTNDINNYSIKQYYNVPKTIKKNTKNIVDQLDNLLQNAVSSQIKCDTDFGFLLSGGLDSSLLLAVARKLYPKMDFKCFTSFSYDESNLKSNISSDFYYSQYIADQFDCNLITSDASSENLKYFDDMVWYLEEPLIDPAALNLLALSKTAYKNGVKVLLSGIGADEIFGGYRRHIAASYNSKIDFLPRKIRLFLKSLFDLFNSDIHFIRRLKKIISNIDIDSLKRLESYYCWTSDDDVNKLININSLIDIPTDFEFYDIFYILKSSNRNRIAPLQSVLDIDVFNYLVDHNLNYTDKMGMAEGVEIRVPYLDLNLFEFSQNLHLDSKINKLKTKYILRQVAERYLPKNLINRSKDSFGSPIRRWIKNDLEMNKMINSRLSLNSLNKIEILNAKGVIDILEKNKKGSEDLSYTIWGLLVFESWYRQFILK